ncbi:hypothetical protein JCM8097_000814 [Rhodosporidiobolus ruineniae]
MVAAPPDDTPDMPRPVRPSTADSESGGLPHQRSGLAGAVGGSRGGAGARAMSNPPRSGAGAGAERDADPALPDDLLEALNREPPSDPPQHLDYPSSTSTGRASLSFGRPVLPVVPQSPLGVPSFPSSPAADPPIVGFSTNRTASSSSSASASAFRPGAPPALAFSGRASSSRLASSAGVASNTSGTTSAPPGSPALMAPPLSSSHSQPSYPPGHPFSPHPGSSGASIASSAGSSLKSSLSGRPSLPRSSSHPDAFGAVPSPSPPIPSSSKRNMFKSLSASFARSTSSPAQSRTPPPPPGARTPTASAPGQAFAQQQQQRLTRRQEDAAAASRAAPHPVSAGTFAVSPAPSASAAAAASPSPVRTRGGVAQQGRRAVLPGDEEEEDEEEEEEQERERAAGPTSPGWRSSTTRAGGVGGETYTRNLERERSSGDEEEDDEGEENEAEDEQRRQLAALELNGERNPTAHATAHATADPSPPPLADFIVAVVGPRNVGKSTVIRRGLKRSRAGSVTGPDGVREGETRVIREDEVGNRVTTTTTSFTLSGERRTIEVLEIDMHLLQYSEEGVVWPDGVPQCEGAMLCYDSTDPTSLNSLSTLLQAFWTRGSHVPLIVLACKAPSPSSPPSAFRGVDPREAAAVCNVYGAGIVQLDGGVEDPQRKAKDCFNWVIRHIVANRAAEDDDPSQPLSPSASTVIAPLSPSPASKPPLARSNSLGLGVVQDAPVGDFSSSSVSSAAATTPGEGAGRGEGGEEEEKRRAQEALDREVDAALRAALGEADEAPDEAPREPVAERAAQVVEGVQQPVQPEEGRRSSKTAALDLYFRRDDLIDKFLFAAVSGNDEQFVTLFLITFRRFARPYDVLEKLIERFEFVAGRHKTDPLLSRFGQMKLCGVLSTWLNNYPGDFTAPSTFGLLQPFLESLLPRGATWVAHYALELVPLLAPISAMSDPESSWALPDKPVEVAPGEEGGAGMGAGGEGVQFPVVHGVDGDADEPEHPDPQAPRPVFPVRRPSLAPSHDSTSSLALSASNTNPLTHSISRLSVPGSVDTADSFSPSPSASTSPAISLSASAGSVPMTGATSLPLSLSRSQTHSRSPRPASDAGTLDTQDSSDALGGSASLGGSTGTGNGAGSKSALPPGYGGVRGSKLAEVSDAVLEMREEDVAMQITRIAWELFGGMSPRDLLRHVLAPRDPANPRIALRDSESNVMRSIAFVNYLAAWTSTLILMQSRPKNRARMLEKMLLVAAALREQENFDSLMGVLAGLNSQPVFRLSETFELVAAKLDGDPRQLPQRPEQPDGDKTRLPKKLRSLNRLMSASKSFAAYRLALANSGSNMLPYLGVHLQDITAVNEVKSDLRDGKVNWTKFQQMGRSAAIVLDCARVAPQLPIDRNIERCILDVPVLDDDAQYAVSYAHQARGQTASKTAGGTKRAKLRDMAKAFGGASGFNRE